MGIPKKLLVIIMALSVSGILSLSIETDRIEAQQSDNPLDALIVDF